MPVPRLDLFLRRPAAGGTISRRGRRSRKDDLPLHHVGVETWAGFVWVHLDPEEAGPIADQFQETESYLANYPLNDLRTAARIVYPVASNWKAIVENYNECYHCGPVHPELVELVPAFRQRGGSELDWESGIPHREGAWTFTASGTTNRRPFPGLTPEEQERHKGQLIYPNLMLSLSADHVAAFTLWPHGPASTTVVCDFLFHPDEIGNLNSIPRTPSSSGTWSTARTGRSASRCREGCRLAGSPPGSTPRWRTTRWTSAAIWVTSG